MRGKVAWGDAVARKLFWRRNRSDDRRAQLAADSSADDDEAETEQPILSEQAPAQGIDVPSDVRRDGSPRPLTDDDRLKARSLIAAWRVGAAWSPLWHRTWLETNECAPEGPNTTGPQMRGTDDDADKGSDDQLTDTITIRADIIREMLEDPGKAATEYGEEALKISNTGAHLAQCTITDGPLNLTALRFEKPLWMTNCEIEGPLVLTDAKLGRLCLDGSKFSSIDGWNVHVDGQFSLADTTVEKWVVLDGGKIEGLFFCDGARIRATEQDDAVSGDRLALSCLLTEFGSSVSLCNDFEVVGGVSFVGASIKGVLTCDGGKFRNRGGLALTCNGAKIEGSVFLRDEFEAIGEVDLFSAIVKGGLECTNGSFSNKATDSDKGENDDSVRLERRVALNCGAATFVRGVLLNGDFEAIGEVNIRGATIKGQLSCIGGKFRNQTGMALNCASLIVGADVFFAGRF